MNRKGIKYEFAAKPWKYDAPGGWYFVSLPLKLSNEIRENNKWLEEGWGRMKANAKIGNSEWQTAIWFDTKQKNYLLPLKAEIRKKEKIEPDQYIKVVIWL